MYRSIAGAAILSALLISSAFAQSYGDVYTDKNAVIIDGPSAAEKVLNSISVPGSKKDAPKKRTAKKIPAGKVTAKGEARIVNNLLASISGPAKQKAKKVARKPAKRQTTNNRKIVNNLLASISAPAKAKVKKVAKKQKPRQTARSRKQVKNLLASISIKKTKVAKTRKPVTTWKKGMRKPVFRQNLAIKKVIQRQLWAFRRNKAKSAYALATPQIRRTFGNARRFMKMVRTSYPNIYRSKKAIFPKMQKIKGWKHKQKVIIQNRKGGTVVVQYDMVKRHGKWRIGGVTRTNEIAH